MVQYKVTVSILYRNIGVIPINQKIFFSIKSSRQFVCALDQKLYILHDICLNKLFVIVIVIVIVIFFITEINYLMSSLVVSVHPFVCLLSACPPVVVRGNKHFWSKVILTVDRRLISIFA